ncbi:MAG TPA: hypothetical protein DF383_10565 [Deltaproteobacteria bacterium]|nr:hypothetical protein [Deltaproteobacteria bacterium]
MVAKSLYNQIRMDNLAAAHLRETVQRRRALRGGRPLARPPRPLSTKPLERRYFVELKRITDLLRDLTKQSLIPGLSDIVAQAKSARPVTDSLRLDDFSDEVDKIMDYIRGQFLREYSESKIIGLAVRVAESVETFNGQQVDKAFRKVFGADYSRFEPWLTQELKAFTKGNVSLIKSIPDQYFEKVEGVVLRGAQAGKLSRDIASDIANQFGVTERRAALIARDQVASFNGQLTKLRQTSVGVTKYTWSDSGDERVRPEHAARDGKIFSWSDPPPGGHPGEDVLCRCVALPVFDETTA